LIQDDDGDGDKKPEANGPTQVEVPINITDEMTKSSLWKSFVKDGAVKKRNKTTNSHHGSSRSKHRHKHGGGKHRSKHSRGSDRDPGLWFSVDKKKYLDSDDDMVELRRLTAIEEDPVVDPKESLDIPEVRITMPSSNGIEDSKDKEA
jgi:hypothetical protein